MPQEKQLLYIDLGKAFELDGRLDEAKAEYQKAVDLGADYKALGQLDVARIWELKKDFTKAKEIYQQVAVEYSNTEYAEKAKMYLRWMNSSLAKELSPNS